MHRWIVVLLLPVACSSSPDTPPTAAIVRIGGLESPTSEQLTPANVYRTAYTASTHWYFLRNTNGDLVTMYRHAMGNVVPGLNGSDLMPTLVDVHTPLYGPMTSAPSAVSPYYVRTDVAYYVGADGAKRLIHETRNGYINQPSSRSADRPIAYEDLGGSETFPLPLIGSPTIVSLNPTRLDYFIVMASSTDAVAVYHGVEDLYSQTTAWYNWTPDSLSQPVYHTDLAVGALLNWELAFVSTPNAVLRFWRPTSLSAYWIPFNGTLAVTTGDTTPFGPPQIDTTIANCTPYIPADMHWTPGTPVYAMSDTQTTRVLARGLDGMYYYQLASHHTGNECAPYDDLPVASFGSPLDAASNIAGRGSLAGFDNGNMIWTVPFSNNPYDLAESFPPIDAPRQHDAHQIFGPAFSPPIVDIATCVSENPALGERN